MKYSQDISMSGKQIKEVGEPTDPGDAINRAFYDKRIASWEGMRYYYLSTKGSDSNKGYSDISPVQASLQPVRSVEKLQQIIPRIGAGASIMITIAPGTYDDLKLSLMDYESVEISGLGSTNLHEYNCPAPGYKTIQLLNLNGSNPIITDTQQYFSRMRFSDDTITTTLRGFTCNYIKLHPNLIEPRITLPARSGEDDILIIEQPATVFNTFDINIWTFNKVKINGILGTNGFRCNSPLTIPDITFCYGPGIL